MKMKTLLLAGLFTLALCSCGGGNTPEPGPTPAATFIVTFNGNGGTLVSGTEIQKVSSASEIFAPTYKRDGYTFNGWDKELTTITTDTTVKAQWTVAPTPIEKFTVTFVSNGGTSVPSQTVEKGELATMPTNPTKENHAFINWYKESTLSNAFNFAIPITSNTTLYAKWVEEKIGECSYFLSSDQRTYKINSVIDKTCTSYNLLATYNNLPVTEIDLNAFYGCTNLYSINIPSSITSIQNANFSSCTSLSSITVDSLNTTFDSRKNCNAIINTETNTLVVGCKNTVIPNDVQKIGPHAFQNCTYLSSITIPNGVISIGQNAFKDCISLSSIYIPSSVQEINWNPFEGTIHLSSITVDPNNSYFDSRDNCNAIIKIQGRRLIVGCKNTVVPNSAHSLDLDAFTGCTYLTSITVPGSVKSISGHFEYCDFLTSIIVDPSNTIYDSRDNCNAIIETEFNTLIAGCQNTVIPNTVKKIQLKAFQNCTSLSSITIPNGVTSIGYQAFEKCTSLSSIDIPDSVTSIGYQAFEKCTSLSSINIPSSVTSIGSGAFKYCSSLTSITVDSSNKTYDSRENCNAIIITESNTLIAGCQNTVIPKTITSIGIYAFEGCSFLTSINIPNGVTSIDGCAFYKCTLLGSVTIPNTVTNIYSGAFGYCINLYTINFSGTKAQWNKVEKAFSSWNEKCPATVVHCTDGDAKI